MSILTKEEIEEGLINLEGWKFQAWRAFVECNEVRDCYKD